MKITNDEQFDKSCVWLVERAKMIEDGDKMSKNPLMDNAHREQWQKERAEHMRKFNIVDREILLYNMPWVVEAWDKAKQPKTELDAWLE